GLTAFEATFWVGANAIIRRQALEDIRDEVVDDGIMHARFIRDNTVIEDTESSIELIDRGWRLYNYPERLSYSMTPSDFGALVVQRRRWANGGLLMLSSLRRYIGARKRQGRPI
ncbi:glycosyltransferase family 2 protein, partial [Pseudomonas sp. PS02285]|uniref:glycosyltransferase family 2 protein n=1 Tax=Pseudomonas sp. PS02285 TaxID=2991441 RepID=UPI00249A5A03